MHGNIRRRETCIIRHARRVDDATVKACLNVSEISEISEARASGTSDVKRLCKI